MKNFDFDDWIKGSADGRATTTVDNQEAWAGAYEGKYEVDRTESMYSGEPHLEVLDKDATDDQLAFREGRYDEIVGNVDEKDDRDER